MTAAGALQYPKTIKNPEMAILEELYVYYTLYSPKHPPARITVIFLSSETPYLASDVNSFPHQFPVLSLTVYLLTYYVTMVHYFVDCFVVTATRGFASGDILLIQ